MLTAPLGQSALLILRTEPGAFKEVAWAVPVRDSMRGWWMTIHPQGSSVFVTPAPASIPTHPGCLLAGVPLTHPQIAQALVGYLWA